MLHTFLKFHSGNDISLEPLLIVVSQKVTVWGDSNLAGKNRGEGYALSRIINEIEAYSRAQITFSS